MAHGRPRDLRKQQQWQRRIQQWQASGLSVRAFCARHGLAEPGFYAWRRKLHRRQQRVADFVPVHILAHAEPNAEDGLEVVLAGGRRLRVRPGFDSATLRQLVAVLEEMPPC
jgi:hypothetical protein